MEHWLDESIASLELFYSAEAEVVQQDIKIAEHEVEVEHWLDKFWL